MKNYAYFEIKETIESVQISTGSDSFMARSTRSHQGVRNLLGALVGFRLGVHACSWRGGERDSVLAVARVSVTSTDPAPEPAEVPGDTGPALQFPARPRGGAPPSRPSPVTSQSRFRPAPPGDVTKPPPPAWSRPSSR